jgi:hypothetical protein
MCNDPKNIKRGCYGFLSGIWICLALVIYAIFIIPYSHYDDYKDHKCNITRVEYPTEIPTDNDFHNNPHWKSCDCGSKCKSWSPCVKLYSSVDKTLLIKNKYYKDRNDDCTFSEAKCDDGLQYVQRSLRDAYNQYTKYINNTIECHYDDPLTNIYLSMDNYLDTLYFPLIIIIFTTICIIIMIIHDCSSNSKNKPEEEDIPFEHYSSTLPEQINIIHEPSLNIDIPPLFNNEKPPQFGEVCPYNYELPYINELPPENPPIYYCASSL